VTCPWCSEPTMRGDRFCESCGASLLHEGFLFLAEGECPVCSAAGADLQNAGCRRCGSSWVNAGARWELDGGPVGAVSDRGWRRARNEDACAVAFEGDKAALVVCDGVASTADAGMAAAVAARRAIAELKRGFREESAWTALVRHATLTAQMALGDRGSGAGFEGCTTFVAVLARPGEIVVANVGDSRAYLVDDGGASHLLTTDDSWAREAVESGLDEAAARSSGRAHEVTAWLGAGAGVPRPHVTVHRTDGAGYLIACSDGLWDYASSPDSLASLVHAGGTPSAVTVARNLVEFALASGGADNVTVAVTRTWPVLAGQDHPEDRRSQQDAELQY
jgi:serine/threonine protein phosphatase PrpC